MREPKQFPTAFARNLWRIMTGRGWSPQALSKEAGLSRGYVNDIISGRTLVPGTKAAIALADVLECKTEDLTRETEPASPELDQARDRMNRRRALDVAEQAIGEDGSREHAAIVFSTAEMVYSLIVEREETLGRPIESDDEEFWRLIDSMARRWMAGRR